MSSFSEVNLCERFIWFSFRESCCSELPLLALQRGYQQRAGDISNLQMLRLALNGPGTKRFGLMLLGVNSTEGISRSSCLPLKRLLTLPLFSSAKKATPKF